MPKMFIVRIGYQDYAVETADAVALLDIAGRLRPVDGYGPYTFTDGDVPFNSLTVGEVSDPRAQPPAEMPAPILPAPSTKKIGPDDDLPF